MGQVACAQPFHPSLGRLFGPTHFPAGQCDAADALPHSLSHSHSPPLFFLSLVLSPTGTTQAKASRSQCSAAQLSNLFFPFALPCFACWAFCFYPLTVTFTVTIMATF